MTIERQRTRNENIIREQRNHQSSVVPLEEERINDKLAIERIKTINGQDDIGVEDFIKNVKRARDRCNQPSILLDLIISKRIQGAAEKALRYTPITSYEDLFSSLRLKIKQTGSVLTLESRFESCKQGQTKTVQNFSIRFKLFVNELRHAIQSKPSASPLERRSRWQAEKEDNIDRYLLNLKREIGLQVGLMNPKTLEEAQNFASETEMWMKESHRSTKQQIVTPRPL